MNAPQAMLILIHYPVDVGFAVGRLVSVFYNMALQCTGRREDIHFAFTDLRDGKCDALPDKFRNYVQFEPRKPGPDAVDRLTSYIRANRIDTLFAMDMPVQAPYLSAARQAGVRHVISYFGAPLSSLLPWPVLALKRIEVRWLRPHRPNHFIVESESMRRTAINGRGIPPGDVSVVRNGVAIERFAPVPEHDGFAFQLYSIPRDRQVVVYMGHFHKRKGVDVLLRAARRITVDFARKDLHFLFLGTRQQDVAAMRQIFDFDSVAGFVTLGGYQDRVSEILSCCSFGCIPTTGWDSFPLSPLEMQACGLPVIVSDCQGLPETIVDGLTGIVTPAGDERALAATIIELADDPARRAAMGRAARVRIESELNLEQQVAQLAAVVRRVAHTSQAP